MYSFARSVCTDWSTEAAFIGLRWFTLCWFVSLPCYWLFLHSFPSFTKVGLFFFFLNFLSILQLWGLMYPYWQLFLTYITFMSDCVKCMRGISYCTILLFFYFLTHSFLLRNGKEASRWDCFAEICKERPFLYWYFNYYCWMLWMLM